MSAYHIPVMLEEVLNLLNIQAGSWYIDCNLGGGGHTEGILKRGGKVLGIDLDIEAITEVANRHQLEMTQRDGLRQTVSNNLILVQTNFINLESMTRYFHLPGVKGVLFDLGVSSHQLETPTRGFSFNQDSQLDMRMDQSQAVKASDLINGLHEKELADIFWRFGEERFARAIARKIVEVRKTHLIEQSNELSEIISSVRRRRREDRTHPATRVFQALRIAVNDELNALATALPQAFNLLEIDGILVVISFHSLEDRIVKNYFRELSNTGLGQILTKSPATPTAGETAGNPRARSGKLRGIAKVKANRLTKVG